ncbi:putative Glycosyltransferase family 1 protein [Bacillus sp. 349Y]|nr:putative Glycosyltransferase family 1 protein [Bacillus sp. 349Y]
MKVMIDAHYVGIRKAGNEVYFENLITEMSNITSNLEIEVLVQNKEWTLNKKIKPVLLKSKSIVFQRAMEIPMKAYVRKAKVLHVPFAIPPVSLSKTVVTIHDILYEDYPEYFTKSTINRLKLTTKSSAKNATHITTVSEFSKKRISEKYQVPLDKITVIPNSISESFESELSRVTEASIKQVKEEFAINQKYFIFVGTIQPRKNITRMIDAFIEATHTKEFQLVIVGEKGWLYDEILERMEKLKCSKNKVIFTGGVSENKLVNLYKGSYCLLYPTIAEGFGIPLLEAMAVNKPIITSDTTSLPEVARDAALYVNPMSVKSIATAIVKIIEDEKIRKKLVDRGTKILKEYDRKKIAENMINVYKKI